MKLEPRLFHRKRRGRAADHHELIGVTGEVFAKDIKSPHHGKRPFSYRELTDWLAPAAGGPRSRDLTPLQREPDREARVTISEELGHEREQITAVYLGR
jgi:hypothetical protein